MIRIASDWHLSPRSPALHGRLAAEFLRRGQADGAKLILNGDVFDDLFGGAGRCQRAHPVVVAALEQLSAAGRLQRVRGNHDPDAGEDQIVLEQPGLGRVLVAHGHLVDPVNRSWIGQLGDGVSRRFGRLRLVRGAAALAETTARAIAGRQLAAVFRARCLELVAREGCDLGIFGHLHEPYLEPGDRYANAGSLTSAGLQYLELGPGGPRLCTVAPSEVQNAD